MLSLPWHATVLAVPLWSPVLPSPTPVPRAAPGTGKTEMIACLVKHVLAAGGDSGRLLLCAPSNLAVDELTRRLVAGRHRFRDGTAHCRL